jgi:alpha-D-ribose 1-methylphosphonate 5-triphosphate synthase subunit PhnI
MAYVAVKGGREAIEQACRLTEYQRLKGDSARISVAQIRDQLGFLVDRVMGEGSLYAPELAALAIKQARGDTFEAAFILRAYRTTQPRLGYSLSGDTSKMRVIRRISSAFKDLPGGQVLGPTDDYSLRLMNFDLVDEDEQANRLAIEALLTEAGITTPLPDTFPKLVDLLRREGLLEETDRSEAQISDITRQSLKIPASRSAALQTLSRGETGGLLCLAYSNMRGYGSVHPTIGELRVGYLPVEVSHPHTGAPYCIGEILVTEAEIISKSYNDAENPKMTLGYGLCYGHNETKAISMGVLDRAIQSSGPGSPSEDQEFVLSHVDGIESMGFCNHFKLPHYVTFQSDLDRLRKTLEEQDNG